MVSAILLSIALFVSLLAGLEAGRWMRSRASPEHDGDADRTGPADGVVFGVLGLLLAFTLSASATRFNERRQLTVDQANALGTAYLRTDLLLPEDREPVRRPMREWVRVTLDGLRGQAGRDPQAFELLLKQANALQDEAWAAAVAGVDRHPRAPYAGVLLPPINDWIDMTTNRLEMVNRGMTPMVMPTLVVLSLTAAVLAGFRMGRKPGASRFHRLAFAGVITFSMYVIMDMNNPRAGLIQVTAVDDVMRRLYESMQANQPPAATQPAK